MTTPLAALPSEQVIRVLLIEDNPGDARLVRELLMEEGDRFGIAYAGSLRDAHDQPGQSGEKIMR